MRKARLMLLLDLARDCLRRGRSLEALAYLHRWHCGYADAPESTKRRWRCGR